ncbi:MAG: hypothetical protein NT116_02310, partial [Candidatus Parcubacteria bacterium]|nr:hypothetical protein [Candidatus Parcubacteria bacterium]
MEKQVIQYKGKYVCTFDELLLCYKELKNVWKVGEVFGISGQMVHKKLTIAGCINKMNIFTQKDLDYLKENYKNYRNKGKLKELPVELGRTKEFLSRKAKMLGLTDKDNHISMKFMSEEFSIRAKKYILEKGHPKGMLGKNHSKKFKVDASKRLKDLWNDPNSKFNSDEFRQKKSDYMAK